MEASNSTVREFQKGNLVIFGFLLIWVCRLWHTQNPKPPQNMSPQPLSDNSGVLVSQPSFGNALLVIELHKPFSRTRRELSNR